MICSPKGKLASLFSVVVQMFHRVSDMRGVLAWRVNTLTVDIILASVIVRGQRASVTRMEPDHHT